MLAHYQAWFSSQGFVQSLSRVGLFATPWTACSIPGFPVHHLLELAQTHVRYSVMPSNHLIICYPLLLLPSVLPSIRVFSTESALHIQWPEYWSLSFSISPSSEYSGLISFRIDWFDLAVQRTLKSLLQHHSLKASVLQHSAFFTVQLSYLCMTTGKTIALTRWTFVAKAVSLLFNMLSRFAHSFLLSVKAILSGFHLFHFIRNNRPAPQPPNILLH